jgi:hypothetical protein
MMGRSIAGFILILSFAGIFQNPGIDSAPALIDQREFKILFTGLSEPEGYFDSERWNAYTNNLGRIPRASNACLVRSYAKTWQQSPVMSDYYMGAIVQSLQSFLDDEAAGANKEQTKLTGISLHAGC